MEDTSNYENVEIRNDTTEGESENDTTLNNSRETETTETVPTRKSRLKALLGTAAVLAIIAGGAVSVTYFGAPPVPQAMAAPTPPSVNVSAPLERNIQSRLQFLGQFSAVDKVELRAQVGGTLTEIGFKDGDIVKKGDLLFSIDPEPYQIALSRAQAQLKTAQAQLELANREIVRAKTLSKTGAGSEQKVDQRAQEQRSAQATVDDAQAAIRDAKFDLERCRIYAPFTGRIGAHLVSAGNLVAGSRAATSPTTLLATIVSLDTIYLNVDMSEADYMKFQRERAQKSGPVSNKIEIALSDEEGFTREGTLDFIDNSIDRSSGTIHARATVQNDDLMLTPGGFARVRLALSAPRPAMLVPDAAVLPDQSEHMVLTVSADNVVTPKKVIIGEMRGGLRVIEAGLVSSDRVVIDGIPTAIPGSKVAPAQGSIEFKAARD